MIEQKTVDRQFLPKNPLFFDATSATSKKHTHLNPTQTTQNTSGWPKNSTYSPRSKPPHQLTTDAILVKINHTSPFFEKKFRPLTRGNNLIKV